MAVDGPVVREHLPCPVVHYPRSPGFFFAFAPDASSAPVLCACARPAVEHAVALGARSAWARGQDRPPEEVLDHVLLPEAVAARAGARVHPGAPLAALQFERGLCHRCNMAAPTLRYCYEVEGGRFMQHYGWYVGQAYLRFGIQPGSLAYLPDVCPEELRLYLDAIEASSAAMGEPPSVADADASPPTAAGVGELSLRVAEHRSVTRAYRRASRSLDKRIENLVREEFGFQRVGEGWVSETMLYQIVSRLLPGEEVLRRHRPEWLEGLELDIYVPDRSLAFEYQGQQHFHPIKVWGGEEALRATQERDLRKARICAERGVTLIAVDYTEPLTETYVRELLVEREGTENV